jgi:predicted transcriptional regulator|tara:strand:- start:641 stop:916 length:276 start_codon:yes stop_codon:yes gene_type:complete
VYRNTYQITEDILDNLTKTGQTGTPVTSLLRQSNLSYSRLTIFVNKLTQSGLINKVEVKNKNIFIITEKGRLYLDEYKKFSSIAESFGLEL